MSDTKLYKTDPRDYALKLVEDDKVSADDMLLCALKWMAGYDVEKMLDRNELSPRFFDQE